MVPQEPHRRDEPDGDEAGAPADGDEREVAAITEAMIEVAWAYLCDKVPEWNRSLGNSRPIIVGMFEAAGFKIGDDDQSKTAEEPRD